MAKELIITKRDVDIRKDCTPCRALRGTTISQEIGEQMAREPTAVASPTMNFKLLLLREKVLGVDMDLEGRVRSGPRASTVVASL